MSLRPRLAAHWHGALEASLHYLRRRARRLALAFLGIALPLALLAELADEVHEAEAFGFDEPLLRFGQSLASPTMDAVMRFASDIGYAWGVVPVDVGLFVLLLTLGHLRRALFFGIAVGGSALLNLAGKAVFARERPDLWLSIAPETTYSFPSGHAMGSATLATVLVLLCWRTPWRWPMLVGAVVFTLWVGASRVYLGVHFPSDILAGWTAAIAWACAVYLIIRPNPHSPDPDEPAPPPA